MPLQPRYMASTFATSGPVHGVALASGVYSQQGGFNPVISMPMNPSASNPDREPSLEAPGWAPANFFGLQHLPGLLEDGTSQRLVIDLGQYDKRTGVERLYQHLALRLYRSDSDDWIVPVVSMLRSEPTSQGIQVRVWASDSSGIYSVLVAYTSGKGTWHSIELSRSQDGIWHGVLPGGGDISYFVQAVDAAGNVTVDDNYGSYYSACVLCRDTYSTFMPLIAK